MKEYLKHYNLGELKDFHEIKEGVVNNHYVLNTSKGKFVLRLSNKTRTFEEAHYEVDLINHVKHLLVPQYIPNKEGEIITVVDSRIVTVTNYVEGEIPEMFTDEMLKQTGEFLGKFHRNTKDFKSRYSRPAVYVFTDERLEEIRLDLKDKFPELSDEIEYVHGIVKKYQFPESFPSGPIHLDVKPANTLAKDGKITVFLDFDNCEVGPYLLDLGRALKWCCYDEKGYSKKRVDLLVSEYEKYRPLTKEEKGLIKESIILAISTQLFMLYHLYLYVWDGHKDYLEFYKNLFLPQLDILLEKGFVN
ncbi:MAG: homoserine kinase [archaeon]